MKAALDRYVQKRAEFMREVLAAPTAREVAERMLLRIADSQTDPKNPPGCLLVQGGLACGAGPENVPFELSARRNQVEGQLRERFEQAVRSGDLWPDADPGALARFLSAVMTGMAVMAAGGATREDLREAAMVALKAFDEPAAASETKRQS